MSELIKMITHIGVGSIFFYFNYKCMKKKELDKGLIYLVIANIWIATM